MEFTKRLKRAEYEQLSDEDKAAYVEWVKQTYQLKSSDKGVANSANEGVDEVDISNLNSILTAQNEKLAEARENLEKKLSDVSNEVGSEVEPTEAKDLGVNEGSGVDPMETEGSEVEPMETEGSEKKEPEPTDTVNGVTFHKNKDTADTDTTFDWGISSEAEALGSGDKKAQTVQGAKTVAKKVKEGCKKIWGKYKKSKPVVKVISLAVLVIIVFAIGSIPGRVKKEEAQNNFATQLGIVLNNNQGSFDYTFEVQALDKKGASETTSTETASGDARGKVRSRQPVHKSWQAVTSAWQTNSLKESSNWAHPNYRVQIKGVCFDDSKDKMKLQAEILLTTAYKSGTFTHIVVDKGKTYINLDEIKQWLKNSQDSYLTGLADDFLGASIGDQYIEYKNDDFVLDNLWASDNTKSSTGSHGLYELRGKESTVRLLFWNYLEPILREASKGNGNGNYSIDMNQKDESGKTYNEQFEDQIKYIMTNSSSAFDTYYDNAKDYYTDAGYSSEKGNKDNVVTALQKASDYLSSNSLNLKVTGKDFVDSEAGEYSAKLNFAYTEDGVDYNISCNLMRSMQSTVDDVTVPDSATKGYDIASINAVADYMLDYFNPTKIITRSTDTTNQSNVNWTQADNFIDLVNSSGVTDQHLNRRNLKDFVQLYANLSPDDKDLTQNDRNCIALYTKNKALLQNLVSQENWLTELNEEGTSEPSDNNENSSDEENKKPSEKKDNKKHDYKGSISKKVSFVADTQKASNGQLLVIGVKIDNKTGSMKSVDLTKFMVENDNGDTYYANSSDILMGYDSNFDTSQLVSNMNVDGNSTSKLADLYFVVPNSTAKFKLSYDSATK